jgi:hypothetical protein
MVPLLTQNTLGDAITYICLMDKTVPMWKAAFMRLQHQEIAELSPALFPHALKVIGEVATSGFGSVSEHIVWRELRDVNSPELEGEARFTPRLVVLFWGHGQSAKPRSWRIPRLLLSTGFPQRPTLSQTRGAFAAADVEVDVETTIHSFGPAFVVDPTRVRTTTAYVPQDGQRS